jgi:hypothetical protein
MAALAAHWRSQLAQVAQVPPQRRQAQVATWCLRLVHLVLQVAVLRAQQAQLSLVLFPKPFRFLPWTSLRL